MQCSCTFAHQLHSKERKTCVWAQMSGHVNEWVTSSPHWVRKLRHKELQVMVYKKQDTKSWSNLAVQALSLENVDRWHFRSEAGSWPETSPMCVLRRCCLTGGVTPALQLRRLWVRGITPENFLISYPEGGSSRCVLNEYVKNIYLLERMIWLS